MGLFDVGLECCLVCFGMCLGFGVCICAFDLNLMSFGGEFDDYLVVGWIGLMGVALFDCL